MKNVFLNAVGVCAMLSLMASCSSTEDSPMNNDGYGTVSLRVSADTQFKSRAVDESAYSNSDNYTVQILKDGKVVSDMEWKYADIPEELIELTAGSYQLKAFYGEDKPASTTSMYVEGIKGFDVDENKTTTAEVSCTPVCARVTIVGDGMDEYFSDWKAAISTKALEETTFTYQKGGDPVYLRVDNKESVQVTFAFTSKESKKVATLKKEYTMSPNEALKITVKPASPENGSLGITIVVDGSTTDKPVDIEIPSEWV